MAISGELIDAYDEAAAALVRLQGLQTAVGATLRGFMAAGMPDDSALESLILLFDNEVQGISRAVKTGLDTLFDGACAYEGARTPQGAGAVA